ncbi:phosphoenolpyruvate synthase, partial [Pseudonocardia acaciae]|uniref:phosphoenolpyruvate synthase n=1 Tax=Pseudonocardia acaciae TaxID=551276 RepID=UPI00048B25D8
MTTTLAQWVRDLGAVSLADAATVGGKAANLGELIGAGFPVPAGFALTADSYLESMRRGGVRDQLARLHADALAAAPTELDGLCERMAGLVRRAGLPEPLADEIRAAYAALGEPASAAPETVAVRSSAVGEDASDASFAGMNATFTNVHGAEELLARIVDCWVSAVAPRVVAYRAERGMAAEPAIAVVVQRMIPAERAGIVFTADPASGRRDRVVVEAAFGQGEVVVSGTVQPDTHVLSTPDLGLVSTTVGHQNVEIVRGPDGRDLRRPLDPQRAAARVLTDAEVTDIARLALRVQEHYGAPQDIEWAMADGRLWLVQARPITALGGGDARDGRAAVLARGLAASPGRVCGQVRVLTSPDQGGALHAGEILVAELTNPDWLPTIRRAAALVTDSGGMTCHAAIVARELGVPAVVGAGTATSVLRDGQLVTVDGAAGEVLAGRVDEHPFGTQARARIEPGPAPTSAGAPTVTGTRLYVNVAVPEAAERAAALAVDGVGLLRAEFLLTEALDGRHPRDLIARGEQDRFVEKLAASLRRIGAAFAPRPVIYRTTDLRSNEFRGLRGGEELEPVERNPMIGYRGAYRYLHEPEVFAIELRALAEVRERCPNLHLMIPFVRTRWELEACLELVDASPLGRHRGLHRWIMAEV